MTINVEMPTNPPALVALAQSGSYRQGNVFIGPDEPELAVGSGAVLWIETTPDYLNLVDIHLGYA